MCYVEECFGLELGKGLLFVVVLCLVQQKGIDLILEISDVLFQVGGCLVSIGCGELNLEKVMFEFVWCYFGQVGVYIGFDEIEVCCIYVGSDFLFMFLCYEFCGFSQFYV